MPNTYDEKEFIIEIIQENEKTKDPFIIKNRIKEIFNEEYPICDIINVINNMNHIIEIDKSLKMKNFLKMSNKLLVECPNCLGTGEALVKGKYMKTCKFCGGEGVVTSETAKALIEEHLLDDDV